jgi:hypothetical protein
VYFLVPWCSVRRAYVKRKTLKTDISDKYLLSAFWFWPNFAVKSTFSSCCKVQDLRPSSDTACCDWIFLLLVRKSEVRSYLKRNHDQALPYLFSKSFAANRWA